MFRRNYFRASYLFSYYENHTQCDKKKRLERHSSMLNVHCACQKAILYFSPALAAEVEPLVTHIVTDVLIHLPVITQRSKACTTFIELLV